MSLHFISIEDALYEGEKELRYEILRKPIGMTREEVVFPYEATAVHLVAVRNGDVVGCVLFLPETETVGRLFQMAVSDREQGRGIGRRLVDHLEASLKAKGYERIHLHARAHAIPFYEKLGYSVYGDPFETVGIPHRHMEKSI